MVTSQLGGMALYGYVHNSNGWARATSSRQQGLGLEQENIIKV